MMLEDVLILIILEYIYMKNAKFIPRVEACLNPYYTGIHLHPIKPEVSTKVDES